MSDPMSGQVSQEGSSSEAGGAPASDPTVSGGHADYSKLMEEMGALKESHSKAERELSDSRRTMGKLKEVFSPEEKGIDAEEDDRQFMDRYLAAALESEKNGQGGLPLTVNLANALIETRKITRQMQQQVAEMKAQIAMANDPGIRDSQTAYLAIDKMTKNEIKGLYGEYRPEVFQAVTSRMVDHVKNLQKNKPEAWQAIAADENLQKQMVRHFLTGHVPPKARQILEDDSIKNTEMSAQDLLKAFKEADSIKDPAQRAKIKTKIRQEYLKVAVWAKGQR